ncbi:hypothetical protein [Arthrobacter ruber]|uniref:hypothetical protein n=1 Tax=Arthrobacter ruber TaxID=1258893 RepID=UPI0012FFEC6A|nr:hypothetical protein [Arthrobacter ruber]
MTDFNELRSRLAEERRRQEELRQEALLAGEAVGRLERLLRGARRGENPRVPGESDPLDLKHAASLERLARARGELAAGRNRVTELAAELASFTDPVKGIGRLADVHPILLLPLRLETRFKPGNQGQAQLWVRVYPDVCLADGFEETLTENEVDSGRAFWAAIWRADGDDSLERAAWRNLVAACGAGRAGWVVRTFVPANPSDKPTREDAGEILLVATGPTAQSSAAASFWEAVWRAGGDPVAEEQARTELELAVGAELAEDILLHHRPLGLLDEPVPPQTRFDAVVRVAVLQVPSLDDLEVRRTSWSSAPRIDLLPERFVLLGYEGGDAAPRVELSQPVITPLVAGPDPNAVSDEQLKPEGDALHIPDDLAWMFSFERAIEVGMAFRFDLTESQAQVGFQRLLVLGVRLADTAHEGRESFERLLEHHLYSQPGLELIRQGTPTNNTTQSGSGYAWKDDPDATFEAFFKQAPGFTPEEDSLLRSDGQRLAEGLGLSDNLLARIPGAQMHDRSEAHAMQIALWPATLGYLMDSMLAPVFSDDVVRDTRAFFTRHVSGRGPLPALRIGKQPYGIQPVSAFSRLSWFTSRQRNGGFGYPAGLYEVLRGVEEDWRPLVDHVSRVGKKSGDPHQILLDVLGLHPTSAEYYPLSADSLDHKVHELSFVNHPAALQLLDLFPAELPLALLRRFGYTGIQIPDLLTKIYRARQTPLDGPLIDDVPLSEADPIRGYAGGDNYIRWLIDAAGTSLRAVQQEDGFDNGKRPDALLYLLLRHAVQLGFYQTANSLILKAGLPHNPAALRQEPPFIHVKGSRESESRYAVLFRQEADVTGDPELTIGDYIAQQITAMEGPLPEHIAALEYLSNLPTARLERLFAEHIDTVSYRFDAWKTGLLSWGLEQIRSIPDERATTPDPVPATEKASRGLYLGAYGWVESLQPEGKTLTPVALPEDVAKSVNNGDSRPLMEDSTSLGLIHAPSINHATAAAVLRNAHVAYEGKLSVNLSSRRVRSALTILEGMRGGQPLGALLGYQLERHIHDHGSLQVRELVYPMRRAFPLAANQIAKTATEDGDSKESIAAMNVIDGRKVLEHLDRTGETVYPFGLTTLPLRTAEQEQTVTNAVAHIRDVNDAVADLTLSESVYQAVMGNYDRSTGMLDAFAKGSYPPEPEVIQTPRSGTALTFRVALHLPVTAPTNPLPGIPMTPLASVEPALNSWLADRLPSPTDVGCQVDFTDRGTGTERTVMITWEDLTLHPADLVYRAEARSDQALGDLDERILTYLHTTESVRYDQPVRIRHTDRVNGTVTWFELEAMLRSLRRLVLPSHPLRPADLMRQSDATHGDQTTTTLSRSRIQAPRDALRDVHSPALDDLIKAIDTPSNSVDDVISAYVNTVSPLAAYRLPQTGIGFTYEWRARTYSDLVDRVAALGKVWDQRRNRHTELMMEYAAQSPTAETEVLLQLLRTAEVLVSTTVSAEGTPTALELRVTAKANSFDAKRAELRQLIEIARPTLARLADDVEAALPLDAFDPEPFDLVAERAEIQRFRTELRLAAVALNQEVVKRVTAAGDTLDRHDTANANEQAALIQEGAKAIFGEDILLVPFITLPPAARTELGNARAYSESGALTKHLTDGPPAGSDRDFPVEDWLHGIARVRDKLHHWENVVLLADALPGAAPPDLTPIQLPNNTDVPWLAMELPTDTVVDSDPLLYTAHWAGPYNPAEPLCGLLIDEWTEVIPGREQTTGVAFHHDRPNAEPPQAWLLALPATFDGPWSWDDLVGAVNDALNSAKMRAIEPVHIDKTAYSALLPATHSAWTFPEISISNNLLRNMQIYTRLATE